MLRVALAPLPARPWAPEAVAAAGAQIVDDPAEAEVLIFLAPDDTAGLTKALEASPKAAWVQLPWAGIEKFVTAGVLDLSRTWTCGKGVYAEPVAEHALALTLGTLRVLQKRARARSWATEPEGVSLYGRNVVVIGAGGIAQEYIRLLAPFEVSITVVRRSPDPVPGADRTVTTDALDEVLPDADVVMIAAAMTSGTSKLFGRRQFERMKQSARLVNIARGGLVDTDALVSALRDGSIAAAGLDVTDPEPLPDGHPLWDEPGAIITPHQADTPEMVAPLLAERVRLNTAAFLDGAGTGFVGVVDPVAGY